MLAGPDHRRVEDERSAGKDRPMPSLLSVNVGLPRNV
jgi:hypothetical protein